MAASDVKIAASDVMMAARQPVETVCHLYKYYLATKLTIEGGRRVIHFMLYNVFSSLVDVPYHIFQYYVIIEQFRVCFCPQILS